MNDDSSSFDLRQINMLYNLVLSSKSNIGAINKLVVDSWALLEMLREVDSHWKRDYLSLVNAVEDVYATAASEDRGLNQDELIEINRILDKMEANVTSFLSIATKSN